MPHRLAPLVVVVPLLALACEKKVIDPISADVDHADPKSVVGGVFYAARSGDPAPLAGLCVAGASAPSVTRICELTPTSPDWASFRRAFERARLNGEPRVAGDRALLNVVYGEDGKQPETMELVKVDGRWYLERF